MPDLLVPVIENQDPYVKGTFPALRVTAADGRRSLFYLDLCPINKEPQITLPDGTELRISFGYYKTSRGKSRIVERYELTLSGGQACFAFSDRTKTRTCHMFRIADGPWIINKGPVPDQFRNERGPERIASPHPRKARKDALKAGLQDADGMIPDGQPWCRMLN
jgi:hypothetical protein